MAATTVIPEAWTRAMARAKADKLHAEKINDSTYAVRSTSKATCTKHLVHVDASGHIVQCDDCLGWQYGGRQRPCKHAGCVASRLVREMAGSPLPVRPASDLGHGETRTRRNQIFREEVA